MQEVEQDKMKLSKTTSYFYALAILANLSLWFKICSDTRWLSGHYTTITIPLTPSD